MSFFSRLFKRKAGGTFVGNALRSIAHEASYGILGNGLMMISKPHNEAPNDGFGGN